MTEAEIRAELAAILREAQDRAELIGAVLALLDADRAQAERQTAELCEAMADKLAGRRACDALASGQVAGNP